MFTVHASRRRTKITGAVAAVAAFSLLAACGSSDGGSSSGSDGDLVVGLDVALSGPAASYGQAQLLGSKARFDAVNASGGIDGHKIRVVTADDQLDPSKAPSAVRKLVESEDALTVSIGGSGSSSAVNPYLIANKVVNLPFGGSSDLIEVPKSTTRLVSPTYDQLAAATVEHAVKELGAKRVGIAYTPDAVGQPALKGTKAALKDLGLPLVSAQEFSATATSLSPQAAKLKAADVDFVVLVQTAQVLANFVKAADQIGFKPSYGTAYVAATPAFAKLVGSAVDGRIYFASPLADPGASTSADLQKWVKKAGGDPTDSAIGLAWNTADAQVALLTKAVKDAGGKVPSRDQVLAAASDLTIDDDYVRSLSWTKEKFTGMDVARIIGLKGGTFSALTDFAPLLDIN